MTTIKREPLSGPVSLRTSVDWLFDKALSLQLPCDGDMEPSRLPMDMYEADDEIVVKASLLGVSPSEVDITIERRHLTIKAKRVTDPEETKRNYHYRELWIGECSRTVLLPIGLQDDGAKATYDNGILTLSIPKAEEARPRQIRITDTK